MGLTNMSVEEFQKLQEMLKFLETFGITEDDLKEIPNMIKFYKEFANTRTSIPRKTEKEKQLMEMQNSKIAKPEDIINMFADDVEEFYPNGR